jgi:glucose/arabinose dehydrogenase
MPRLLASAFLLTTLTLPVLAADAPAKKADDVRSPAEQLAAFKLPESFKIELVASEPVFFNPVAMAQDDQGRIYVSESHTYRWGPKGSPVDRPSNPIVRLDPSPDGKGFTRTVVAEGFEDPVMGILVRDGKLWCTACQFCYVFDLDPATGKGINRKTLVTDKSKAWNPFGMFGIEWGPDGWIYMSVGDHNIELTGTTNSLKGRGRTGLVVRFRPDGSQLEQLAMGLRVPYSFELDPFGQLWLLSNGEGNPNRYLRVIENVDYHCFTRSAADNEWLAGRRPMAPPTT